MPTFSDFETFGEPLAITEDRGHVSTVWRARKANDLGDPTFAVKYYVPQRRKSPESQAEDTLANDPAQNFLAGIKQLQKARSEGVRGLAPIHDFGFADEGVWYATDFYPRNTLKAWIARRGGVDSAALRQVVHSIATGCQALKLARGFSHGNLKAANVFLVGKPRPLRGTPLHLADAYPAAPLQLARLARDGRRVMDEPSPQVMEVQDLRALGELLLQLVEGRLVTSAYDYNYPIASSPAWERLGRDGQRWCDLCNRLLDPQLSLDKLSLESLAKEFRPSSIMLHKPKILAATGAVCLLVVGAYLGLQVVERGRERRQKAEAAKLDSLFSESKSALEQNDFATAIAKLEEVLRLKPNSPEAAALKTQAGAKLEAAYQKEFTQAQSALTAGTFDEAEQFANRALQLKKGDKAAGDLMKEAQTRRNARLTQAEQDRNYQQAIDSAQAALALKDFVKAVAEADHAMGYRANDAGARKIKADAETGLKNALAQAERDSNYLQAMEAGRTALKQKDYAKAMTDAERALGYRANDAAAQQLKSEAETERKVAQAQAEQDRNYQRAMDTGLSALAKNDFASALTEANRALGVRTNDAAALKLKSDAEKGQKGALAQAEQDRNYTQATEAAKTALDRKDYPKAITEADRALSYRANDPAAAKLKADAEKGQKNALAQAEQDRNYTLATEAAKAALDRKDYPKAITEADRALSYRANDPVATKLKADAETAQKNVAAQVERDRNYQKAMEAAKASLARNDHPQAIAEAKRAMEYRANDTAAKQLISDAETRQKEAQALAAREKDYQLAMTEATNAWRKAESASKQTIYEVALTEATAALNKCTDAEKLKPGEAVTQLKLELEKLLGSVRTAKAEIDYSKTESLRQSGKVEDALQICQGYSGNSKFEGLKKSLTDMKTAHSAADTKLAKGEYDFLGTLKSSGFDTNPFFAQVVASGRSESEQLSSLTKLKDDNQRLKLKDQLQALPKSVSAKKPFQELQTWVNNNDPKNALDRQLNVFKVWFEVIKPSNSIIDPTTGKVAQAKPKGARPAQSLFNMLDQIRVGYRTNGLLDQKQAELGTIEQKMNSWDN